MIENFKNIEYLKFGNERQKLAYSEIRRIRILEKLKEYNPILTGTIPIQIDLPESDLDIICHCTDHLSFSSFLQQEFSNHQSFKVYSTTQNEVVCTIAEFISGKFQFEVFGQNIPTEQQNAYRHMIIENQILMERGIRFKQEIIALKSTGIKTEPAFAKLLGLNGNPYIKLLKLADKNSTQ